MINYQRYRGDFAVALRKLASAKPKQRFATPAEAMDERIRQGVKADICTGGAWYNASFNEVNGRVLATKGQFNPLIEHAQQATEAMRTGEFYLTDEILLGNKPATEVLLEIVEQDAKKPIYRKRVIDLRQTEAHDVPTNCFGDDDTIVFLAESKARANKYGLLLRNKAGIKSSKVYMQDLVGKNKSRGFWLNRLDVRSDFYCDSRDLYYDNGSLFGVYESGEATSPKILPYTEEQAGQYLSILRGVREGTLPNSKLEEVISFFNKK